MSRVDEDLAALRGTLARDPRAAADQAAALARSAAHDPALRSGALAVLGRARRALGAIDLAEADLLAAIDAAGLAGDDDLAADAHLGLAGVYAFAGRSADALTHLAEVQRLGSARLRAYGALQRAALDQRVGRLRDALTGYERALPELHALDARADIAIVLMNRGVIRTQLGELAAAVGDLTAAADLFETGGNGYGAAQAAHGLGWAHARGGDLPAALAHLDAATDRFRDLGHGAPEVEVDRIEVLLAAGLFSEALPAALDVAPRLVAAGNHWHAAEAWLLCAQAALLGGDRAAAAAHAERACRLFADHGSPAWERAARLELLRARGSTDLIELDRLVTDLDQAGNVRAAATATALACVAALAAGDHDQAATWSARCAARARRAGVFEVRMQARFAVAACAAARGADAEARRHVAAGLADLRVHRASIAAPDARAAVAVHAEGLGELGLRLAWRTGSARTLLDWMERLRDDASPVPEGGDPHAVDQLTALRAVAGRVRAAEADGRDTVDLLHEQRDLERALHRRGLRSVAAPAGRRGPGPAPSTVGRRVSVSALRSALGAARLVSLAVVDGRLVGVVVEGSRAVVRAELGAASAVVAAAAAATAALRESLAVPDGGGPAGLLRRAAAVLERVLGPVLGGDGPVVLVVPAALHAVPWQLVPSLAGRPVTVAPSATWWHHAVSTAAAGTGRAVVVAGPRLAFADDEVVAVAAHHPGAVTLTGPAATSARVTAALNRAGLLHVACHGRIRDDNALWSSLELFDGPLYLYDLDRATRTPPLVVLSGCETGVGVRVGDQLLGLSTALLRRGTRALVAAVCPVPDSAATRDAMIALHRRLAAGDRPAAALAALAGGGPGTLVAAALVCFGAG